MRRLLIALGLVASPALAALDTVTIQGRVVTPDGNNATGGSIECTLSAAGTADDTVSGQSQRVALRTISSIGSDGAVSMTLVPNDDITPASTYYSCRFLIPATGSLRRYDWSEMWSLASSPDPIDIGDITRLDTPVGIAAVAAGGSTTQVQFNNAGALAGDSDWTYNSTTNTQTLGLGIITEKVRYRDSDSNGDGTIDSRIAGDYDGDGTLEETDIESAILTLCDKTGDGTLTQADRVTGYDTDQDGTDEGFCGSLKILPGRYVMDDARQIIDVDGVQNLTLDLRGVILDATFARSDGSSTDVCGAFTGAEGMISFKPYLTGTCSTSVVPSGITVIGGTINGPGARPDPGGGTDCDADGTQSESGDDSMLGGIQFEGMVCDDGDGTYNDEADFVRAKRIQVVGMVGRNCDRECAEFNLIEDGLVKDCDFAYAGEHASAVGSSRNFAYVNNRLGNSTNQTWGSRGIEIFCNKGLQAGPYYVLGNRMDNNFMGLGILTGVDAPNGSTCTFSDFVVADNVITNSVDASATGGYSGYGISIQPVTVAVSRGTIRNNIITGSDAEGIVLLSSTLITDVVIEGNYLSGNCETDTGSNDCPEIALVGARNIVRGNTIRLADLNADSTYTSSYGIYTADCDQCVIEGNHITGTLRGNASGAAGIRISSGVDEMLVRDNFLKLTISPTQSYDGIRLTSSPLDVTVEGNQCQVDPANNVTCFNEVDGGDRIALRNNTFAGGSISARFDGGSDDVLVSGNRMKTSFAGNIPVLYFGGAAARPVVIGNKLDKSAGANTGDGIWIGGAITNGYIADNFCYHPGGGTGDCYRQASGTARWDNNRAVITTASGCDAAGTCVYNVASVTASGNWPGDCGTVTGAATIQADGCDYAVLTGSTNIDNVNSCNTGLRDRVLTLACGGYTGTINDSAGGANNLELTANLVCTADDTLTIKCDGTNWLEIARAVN